MSYDFNKLKPEYAHMWEVCKIDSNKKKLFEEAAAKIKAGEATYKDLENKTGVPWYLIGMLHYRESDCNFHTHLHNGDSLRARTVHVPRGRPVVGNPPFDFEYSAIDALRYEGFDKIHDWSIERVLYCMEQYNGWGYRQRGYPSAYVWAGTNDYHSGKFVSDGVFSAYVVDSQLGCAGILKTLLDGDTDIDLHSHGVTVGSPKTHTDDQTSLKGVSRKWDFTTLRHWFNGSIAGGGLFVTIGSYLDAVKPVAASVKDFMGTYGLVTLVGVCVLGILGDYLLRTYMLDDVNSGRAAPSGVANDA